MITAKQAREIAQLPQLLIRVEKEIIKEAKEGAMGVWIPSDSHALRSKLSEQGFQITAGSGIDDAKVNRDGHTWVYWGTL